MLTLWVRTTVGGGTGEEEGRKAGGKWLNAVPPSGAGSQTPARSQWSSLLKGSHRKNPRWQAPDSGLRPAPLMLLGAKSSFVSSDGSKWPLSPDGGDMLSSGRPQGSQASIKSPVRSVAPCRRRGSPCQRGAPSPDLGPESGNSCQERRPSAQTPGSCSVRQVLS